MSIGTFAWAGRTAAAAAARHVMNLLPAAIHRNNRKNKGSTDTLNGSVLPKKWAVNVYRVVVCIFVYVGSVLDLNLVWGLADITMGIMALLNLIAIIGLSGVVYVVLKDYVKQHKQGKDPEFYLDNLPIKINNATAWKNKKED